MIMKFTQVSILISLLFFLSGTLFSQTLKRGKSYKIIENGAIWEYEKYCEDLSRSIFSIRFGGDTIFEGKRYKKVETIDTVFGQLHSSYCCSVREESNKVYCLFDQSNKEVILYNFNLRLGDFFISKTNRKWEVVHKNSVSILNESRNEWILRLPIPGHNNYFYETWIEGIGSLCGLINTECNIEEYEITCNMTFKKYYRNGKCEYQNKK